MFQVLFTLQNAPWPKVRLADLTISHVPLDSQTAKFDLWLSMRETEAGLQTEMEYNVDLFDAATIQRMMGHFETLLESIAADPDQPIARLPILTERERRQILVDWNDTAKDYPNTACLHQLVEAQAARSPAAVAVDFEGQQLTFAELNRSANRLARYLARYNVQPDTPVGVCLERSPEMVISLLAILKAGGAYAPLDPDYPPERLGFMIADSRPAAVLTTRTLAAQLPDGGAAGLLGRDRQRARPGRRREPPLAQLLGRRGLRDLHFGLDGQAQGRPEHAPRHLQPAVVDAGGLRTDGRGPGAAENALQLRRFGVGVLLAAADRRPLGAGPAGRAQRSPLPGPPIAQQRITTLHFVPSMLAVFLEDEEIGECRAVKRVICSGEALSYELQQRFFALTYQVPRPSCTISTAPRRRPWM